MDGQANMWLAVLDLAFLDLVQEKDSTSKLNNYPYRERAIGWFLNDDICPRSFRYICAVFDFSPERVREFARGICRTGEYQSIFRDKRDGSATLSDRWRNGDMWVDTGQTEGDFDEDITAGLEFLTIRGKRLDIKTLEDSIYYDLRF